MTSVSGQGNPTNGTAKDSKAYKILSKPQWEEWQASGTFSGAGIDINDGFIHLSTAPQAGETYDKFFAGQSGLVLAEVDLEKLGSEPVKWEPSRHGELFPHVYGKIPLTAVVSHSEDITRDQLDEIQRDS